MAQNPPDIVHFDDDGSIPNAELPVLICHGIDEVAGDAAACEALFERNGWWRFWRDGIYSFHHFHSTAHEALGVVAWRAEVVLGGPVNGKRFGLEAGDVAILPAGTGHCNAGSSRDLLVVGAYPVGQGWDLRRGIRPSTMRWSPTSSRCRCPRRIRCAARTGRCSSCGGP